MKKALRIGMTILAAMVSGYAIVQYLIIGSDHAGLVQQKLESIDLDSLWYGMLYTHVVGSAVALLIGPFNLSTTIRQKNIKLHRIIGRVYVVGVGIGGISGIYLAFYATGGMISTIAFLSLDILWLATVLNAVRRIKERRANLHRQWMIRNYALTLAGVTLRLWLVLFMIAFGEQNFVASYQVIAWLCWVPNLIAAEIYLKEK